MIEAMPRPRLPNLHREKTRHGRFVWYVRVDRGARIRLTAEYGTPEFEEEYHAALGGEKPKRGRRTRVGSLLWLYERYRETAAWTDLSPATRRARENMFRHIMDASGEEPFDEITRGAVEKGRDRRSPAQGRKFLDAMRGLFRWAVDANLAEEDPTKNVKNPRQRKTEGFPVWSLDDVAQYEAYWPVGTRQRVWLHVLLYIGCRRGDAVAIGKQHVRDGVITFITEKGKDRKRIEVTRFIEPELAATIARGPCGDLAFICGARGEPLTKESFGNEFRAACNDAGIRGKAAHGLRKLAATLWAERGATEHEIMAMFGWTTPQMASLYTRTVHRRNLSVNAHERLMPAQHKNGKIAG